MTYLLVTAFFPPYPISASLRMKSFADALARKLGPSCSSQMVVLTAQQADLAKEPYQIVTTGKPLTENSGSLISRSGWEIDFGLRCLAKIAAMKPRPKLVIVSSPPYLALITICLGLLFMRVRFAVDIRDLYPEAYSSANLIGKSSPLYGLFNRLSRALYRRAAAITTVTKAFAERIAQVSGRRDVKVVLNGYPAWLVDIRQEKLPRFTVCAHGVLGFFQDVESLMELARRLEQESIDVIVVGYGRKEALLKVNTPANLRHLGRLSVMETLKVASGCHVGLCLRTDDALSQTTFPVRVFEFIGLKMPVILTPPSECGDYLVDTGCGMVFTAGAIEEMASAIVRLRDDQIHYAAFQKACEAEAPKLVREELAEEFAEHVISIAG